MRHVSRTHRVALDWLFDRITLDAKIQIHFIDSKHQQIADIVTKGNFTVMSGTTSSFVEHLPSHFSLLQRRRQDCGKSKTNSDEHDSNCLDKILIREPSDCVEKPGDTQSIYRETWCEGKKRFKTRLSVEFSRKAERCILWRVDGWSSGGTCRDL